jgi:hypothetical protein
MDTASATLRGTFLAAPMPEHQADVSVIEEHQSAPNR